jgi:membrane protease YdiL (CAAX protease family)
MSRERLTRADLLIVALAVVLGGLGVFIAIRGFEAAFPEASIEFKVSRPEIEQRAADFLERRGFDLSTFPHQLVVFRYDDTAKTYLERELGLEEANRLMVSEINVWRWKVRFFRPPDKEELLVYLDPAGELVGFEHIVEEEQSGARLNKEQARGVAEIFLYAQLGVDLEGFSLVEDAVEERPDRIDHRFAWERDDFKAKDATYRVHVTVQGDQIGRVLPHLKVPEQWERDYRRLRSRNETLQSAAVLLYIPLLVAVVIVLLPRIRQRRLRWRPLLWFSGVMGALNLARMLNEIPLSAEGLNTAMPYWQFVVGQVANAMIQSIAIAIFIALLAASGSAVYREIFPDKVAISRLFTFEGMRTKEFFRATIVGYALAGIQLGYVVVFYVFAGRFGAWSPAEVPYSNFLSTAIPWIYPLTVALLATTTEEFAFRLFAIPFLKKYLKSTWLAVLIPAFVWGFLHSGYPQQPAWIRGVEVGLVGVVFGFVMLRYGILATLVAHYTYNAVLISLPLLQSENFYFLVAGGLVMDLALIPFVIAGVLYWQHGRFASSPKLFNAAPEEPPPESAALAEARRATEEPVVEREVAYVPLPRNTLLAGLAAGVVGLAVWSLLPSTTVGSYLQWNTGRDEAEQIADRFLGELAPEALQWRRVTSFSSPFQSDEAEYVRRAQGSDYVNELWSERLPMRTANWEVKYYRPLEKERYRLYVSPDGDVRYYHDLDETAPGAELTPTEAEALARGYVAREYDFDLSSWNLVESEKEERDHRVDHTLIWEEDEAVVAGANLRVRVSVQGDEPSAFGTFLKVPEEWLRDLQRTRVQTILGGAVIFLLAVGVVILGAFRLPQHRFRWKLYAGLAIALASATLLWFVNQLSRFGFNYDTSVPWISHVFQQSVGLFASVIGAGFFALIVALYADLLYAFRYPLSTFLPPRSASRGAYYRDALLVGLSGAFAWLGVAHAAGYIRELLRIPQRSVTPAVGTALDAYLPGLAVAVDSVSGAALAIGVLAVILAAMIRHVGPALRPVVVIAGLGFIAAIPAMSIGGFMVSWVELLALGVLIVLGARHLFRQNLLAYLVAFATINAVGDVLYYAAQPLASLKMNAFVAVAGVIGAILLIMAVFAYSRRSYEARDARIVE